MSFRRSLTLLSVVVVAACSHSGQTSPVLPSNPSFAEPDVAQRNHGASWTQFHPKTESALYSAMALGPDGAVWFLDENDASLVRIDTAGQSRVIPVKGLDDRGIALAVGADAKFYIGNQSSTVFRVSTSGSTQMLSIPSGDTTSVDGMTLGPDGNVWLAEFNHIGKIAPSGKITEYAYPPGYDTNQYGGVTVGADGNIWFALSSKSAIGRVVASTGAITMFPIGICIPAPVVLGNDGNVWFACLNNSPLVGSISPSGAVATYAIGATFNTNETEQFCSRGPDGEPWCASGTGNSIFRIDTTLHTATSYTPPLGTGERPDALVAGADGNIWVDTVGSAGEIDVFAPNPLTVKPATLTFSANGLAKTLTVHENGTTKWTATSSNASVVTVAPGASAATFTATSVAAGTANITVRDAVGNSVSIHVTVTS